MNATKRLLLWAFAGAAAFSQNAARPEFEVATIRPSGPAAPERVAATVRVDGAQVRWASLTLKDYISSAYRVKLYQVSGPDWISTDRFDIAATLPPGGSPAQNPEMLQRLLEERFQLTMHRERKDFPVYVLEVAKGGLKIQQSAPDPNAGAADANAPVNMSGSGSGQGISVNLGRGSSYTFSNNKFEGRRLSMGVLAANLERFVDRPVVDMTEVKGRYDFALELSEEDYRAMLIRAAVTSGVVLPPQTLRLLDGASLPSLFDAMQKAGLRLDARKAPLEVLVIDAARKNPTDN